MAATVSTQSNVRPTTSIWTTRLAVGVASGVSATAADGVVVAAGIFFLPVELLIAASYLSPIASKLQCDDDEFAPNCGLRREGAISAGQRGQPVLLVQFSNFVCQLFSAVSSNGRLFATKVQLICD
jgi:hypothetical protein